MAGIGKSETVRESGSDQLKDLLCQIYKDLKDASPQSCHSYMEQRHGWCGTVRFVNRHLIVMQLHMMDMKRINHTLHSIKCRPYSFGESEDAKSWIFSNKEFETITMRKISSGMVGFIYKVDFVSVQLFYCMHELKKK